MNQPAPIAASGPALSIASSNCSPRISATRKCAAPTRAAAEFFGWLAARRVTQLADIVSVRVASGVPQVVGVMLTSSMTLACVNLTYAAEVITLGASNTCGKGIERGEDFPARLPQN